VVAILGSAIASFALGWFVPKRSSIWIAAAAWPVADWLRILPGVTHPTPLVLIPAALCAVAALWGVSVRKARDTQSMPR
jgi:hypothetical protein